MNSGAPCPQVRACEPPAGTYSGASAAALIPGRGLRELYGDALDATQYSLLVNLLLTF